MFSENLLRNIPSVDKILKNEKIEPLLKNYSYVIVREAVRKVLEDLRRKIKEGLKSLPDEDKLFE
jgi:hypothetical protein